MSEKKYIRVERHKWPDEILAEKKERQRKLTSVAICVLCFFLGIMASVVFLGGNHETTTSKSKFGTIYEIMEKEWYFGKDVEDLDTYLLNNAIYGLTTNEYDIHTNYMDEKRASEYLQKLQGSVVGIGITMAMIDNTPYITRVYASSPAEDAGLEKGDIIHKIDGISASGKTIDELADLTKGKEGTKVTYEVKRNGKVFSFEMTRALVQATTYGYKYKGEAILDIESISENTDQEVEYYLQKFTKEKVDRIILDLRENTGGYVDTVVNICSLFMEKGKPVLYEVDKDGNETTHKTKKSNVYTFDKVVILMDQGTASAAEVMASCLKANIGAVLVGVNSYGKGTVQVSHQFKDGSYIKYTIAEWLTAKKEKINKVGIKPDVEVKLHPVFHHTMSSEKGSFALDSVSTLVKDAQLCLDFLGFKPDRIDGYFSNATMQALHAYQKAYHMDQNDYIDDILVDSLFEKVSLKWMLEQEELDIQLQKAVEIVK